LDSASAKMLMEKLTMLNDTLQATILMVTHDAFTASYADRVIFIKDGKLFQELHKQQTTRQQFFDQILHTIALSGTEPSNDS
jgi:putative ABC transport system ATP-binding protein